MVKSEGLIGIVQLELDGTCAETRFRLSAKRTSPCDGVGDSSVDYWQPRSAGRLVAFVLCWRGYAPRCCEAC
jgi:hypothetical protein